MVGFIGEKFWWNTKIPIFWRFCPQNVTHYRPTQVMNRKKIIICFPFAIVAYILCCLKVIFWWFGRIYLGKILMKYLNIYISMILGPKWGPLPSTQVMNRKVSSFFFSFPIVPYILCCLKVIFGGLVGFIGEKFWWNTKIPIFWRFCPQNVTLYRPTQVMNHKKIIIFFTFTLVPYILCCLKVIFWWFGMSHWWKILMKYQNTHILTIMAPKCDPLPPYPGHESRKYHYFFHFCSSSLHIMLLKDNFLVVW